MSGLFRHAESLEDIDAVFQLSRNREGRSDIGCAYCRKTQRLVTRERARHWFTTHECSARYVSPLTKAQRSALVALAARYAAERARQRAERVDRWHLNLTIIRPHLTARCFPEQWREMDPICPTRSYGGHRHGIQAPTAERLAHEKHIDASWCRSSQSIPAR